jgi:hypothetical protein
MRAEPFLPTLNFYPNRNPKLRFFALWYFTILITLWTIVGHAVLGFEQSYATPLAAVAAACMAQFLFEWIDARATGRAPRYSGGWINVVNMLPPAIIPGLACAMLLYPSQRLWPVVFASVLSIASKVLFRAPVGTNKAGKTITQHIFNPSNFGITATLIAIPSVGLAPPYMFTENITGIWNWIIPGIILVAGAFVHAKFTGRFPLVAAWVTGFVLQGMIRAAVFGIPALVPLVPMTSAAFMLFTLFMIPDPATTPIEPKRQMVFGFAVALLYGLLFVNHIVFGMFIALAATSLTRGAALYVGETLTSRKAKPEQREFAPFAAASGAD